MPDTPLSSEGLPNPLGVGSENAPYASRLGRGCGADGMLYLPGELKAAESPLAADDAPE
jgi:hypothetical protein